MAIKLNNKQVKKSSSKSKLLMTDSERERVDRILSLQLDMINVRQEQIDKWEDNIKRQQFEKDQNEAAAKSLAGRSNIRIPLELAFVESKTSDEVATLPFPKVLPTEEGDIEDAKEMQKLLDFVLYNVLNINEILFRMHIHKNTLGDCILKPYFYSESRDIKKPIVKMKNGEKVISFKKERIKYYDDIKVDLIDIRNFLIDPIVFQAGKTLEDANYCEFVSLYEYEAFKKIFENRGGYKNIPLVEISSTVTDQSAASTIEQDSNLKRNKVEVIEHWDVLNDELTVIAGEIEIRNTPIPYFNPITGKKSLPIAHFVGHYKITGFYNFSEIDLVSDLVEERQTQRNINIDAAKAYTHPFLAVGGTNDFDSDEFVWGLNSVAEVEDVNQIKQFSMAGNSGLPFSLEAANQNDAIVVTGNDVTGILPSTGQTATETLEKKESAMKRTRMTTMYNELNGYRRLYSLIKDLILQFYSMSERQKVTGKKAERLSFRGKNAINGEPTFFEIDKKVLEKEYDISIVANNQIPASREIKKLRDQEALQVIGSLPVNPETGQLPPHLIPAVKKVLENMEISADEINTILGTGQSEEPSELEGAMSMAQAESGEEPEGNDKMELQKAMMMAQNESGEAPLSRPRAGKSIKEGGMQETIQRMTQV